MYRIEATLEGIAPILFNAFLPGTLGPGTGPRQKSEEYRRDEAAQKVYKNAAGLFLPSWNLKRCIIDGYQVLDLRVPGNKNKRLWRFVMPVLFVEPSELSLGKETFDYLDERPGRLKDGSATIVRRPALDTGWRVPFSVRVLDDLVRAEELHLAVQTAGERVGLGGFRPGSPRGGEFGRFVIVDWTVGS